MVVGIFVYGNFQDANCDILFQSRNIRCSVFWDLEL